jgi:hypothetical protein
MRDDPYPARFYGRQFDEPLFGATASLPPIEPLDGSAFTIPQPLIRLLLLLMTLYLCCALFLIFAVTSYAAPLGSATIFSQTAASCVESATVAAR